MRPARLSLARGCVSFAVSGIFACKGVVVSLVRLTGKSIKGVSLLAKHVEFGVVACSR